MVLLPFTPITAYSTALWIFPKLIRCWTGKAFITCWRKWFSNSCLFLDGKTLKEVLQRCSRLTVTSEHLLLQELGFKMHYFVFLREKKNAFVDPDSSQMGFPKPCGSAECSECPLLSDTEFLSKLLWKSCLFSLPALEKIAQRASILPGGYNSPKEFVNSLIKFH